MAQADFTAIGDVENLYFDRIPFTEWRIMHTLEVCLRDFRDVAQALFSKNLNKVAKQMAEASLLPAIRKSPDSWVVADGTSCRHQIADGTQREAVHIAKILAAHL